MADMNVLHLIDSGGLYGAERMLLALVEAQQALGIEPMILSAGEPGIEPKAIEMEAERRGLPVKIWRMRAGLNKSETRRICEWAEEWGADVLHSHGYKFNILLGFFGSFKKHTPLVTTLHGYVHAPRFSRMWVYESIDRFVIHRLDGVVLVGDAMKGEIPERLLVSPTTRVIPNGLNIAELKERSATDLEDRIQQFINNHEHVIVGVGRLSLEKGFDYLLRAFAKVKKEFPSLALVLVGEGSQRVPLENLIEDEDLDEAVLMPGYCNNVPALLKQARLLVMPSLTEGLPITLLEAMAIETPVLVSAVGEMPKVLGYGRGGGIVNSIEPAKLASAIVAELQNPESTKKTAWSALAITKNYSSDGMAKKYLSLYESVVNSFDSSLTKTFLSK